ncbi:MAG TPA: hypothetical protein VNY27_03755 [Solirubrobacteraceae bacterium]|nr:hypothetical protein [Solirubrobacteraceae bacterium]
MATLSACCACAAATSAVAQTETNASMRPSLLPDRLGASSALTLAFRFAGGAEGVPAPLRGMVVHLPAGLTVSLRGVKTCAKSRLQRRGPSGCPAGSLVGRGQALMKVHAGSQAVPEEAAISIFRSPSGSGRPTFEIYGHGETPLDQSSISTAVLQPDAAPYGLKVSVSVPPIPTLVLEPDASVVSLSVTVGGTGRTPRAHAAAGSIRVPRSCPAEGFPFAADFTFADGSTASTSATVACP